MANHEISFTAAGAMTKKYRDSVDRDARKALCFDKDIFATLAHQDGCERIRFYFGLDSNDELQLIIVGVDDQGNDQVGTDDQCYDIGDPCPSVCSTNNILNS